MFFSPPKKSSSNNNTNYNNPPPNNNINYNNNGNPAGHGYQNPNNAYNPNNNNQYGHVNYNQQPAPAHAHVTSVNSPQRPNIRRNMAEWFYHYDTNRNGLEKHELVEGLVQTLQGCRNANGSEIVREDVVNIVEMLWPVFVASNKKTISCSEFCASAGMGESIIANFPEPPQPPPQVPQQAPAPFPPYQQPHQQPLQYTTEVNEIAAIFPEIPRDRIVESLRVNNGNKQAAVAWLLANPLPPAAAAPSQQQYQKEAEEIAAIFPDIPRSRIMEGLQRHRGNKEETVQWLLLPAANPPPAMNNAPASAPPPPTVGMTPQHAGGFIPPRPMAPTQSYTVACGRCRAAMAFSLPVGTILQPGSTLSCTCPACHTVNNIPPPPACLPGGMNQPPMQGYRPPY